MSNIQAPMPRNHPCLAAWNRYSATEEFANTRRWAGHQNHVDGSLWAAFEAGWRANQDVRPEKKSPLARVATSLRRLFA